ncbi:YolD-like family protein [Bacillus safensis]|uniref:YolD-like family protein n=1 Tax=Bacillus safensis TaxID=561879 RepID=UPI002DBE491C|nr:YolD-like family protein [Bacillus safensis]MEC0923934.1 YolD-like family protein [Bacillus safensis]MEC0997050.1 YolD-like family protein [Bacillus safensis]MEC1000403.1 YolD-like family protein [Bacillus safensis]
MWNEEKDQNRWKMKFILPEHNEALRQLHLSKKKIEQPILSPEQLEEFEYTIATAMSEDMPLNFELFDNGFVREISGRVVYVDHIKKLFHVKDNRSDTNLIKFADILNVKTN